MGGASPRGQDLALRASTHVPLIVRTPWTAGNGTTDTKPVLNIDFASTISEIAGIPPGGPQDGTSFLPLLEGRHAPWRTSYLLEYLGKNKLGDAGPPPYLAIHTSRYLYVEYRHDHWQELYDLSSDPWELQNVAADPAYRRDPTPAPRGAAHALRKTPASRQVAAPP